MALAYHISEGVYRGWANIPAEELLCLLKSLFIKKEQFRKKATIVIDCCDLVEDSEPYNRNSVSLQLDGKTYYCDEYTYFNSLWAQYERMDYDSQKSFEKGSKKLTLEKYKSFSKPLKNNPISMNYSQ